jgi:hypothetical protein
MSDQIKVKVSPDGAIAQLRAMLDRGKLVRGWLNRVAYPMLVQIQRYRWESENLSEGGQWVALKPEYATRKLKKFADYPGGGRKILIATGRLVQGMTGDNKSDHYKLVTDTSLEVGTTVSYAKYVDEKRTITRLSSNTIQALRESLSKYITRG